MKKNFLTKFAVLAVCTFILCANVFLQPSRADAAQPNIILINVDNMGVGDICGTKGAFSNYNEKLCVNTGTGTGMGTPYLDKLAADGVTLSNFYTLSPLCTPSRAALMTGLDSRRVNMLLDVSSTQQLPLKRLKFPPPGEEDLPTLAFMLKNMGYDTGIVGKWNLSWGNFKSNTTFPVDLSLESEYTKYDDSKDTWRRGFDYNFQLPLGVHYDHNGFCLVEKDNASTSNPKWYYIKTVTTYGGDQFNHPYTGTIDACDKAKNSAVEVKDTFALFSAEMSPTTGGEHSLTRILSEKAKIFIDAKRAGSNKPFFLYLAYPAPHGPEYIHMKQAPISSTDTTIDGRTPEYVNTEICQKSVNCNPQPPLSHGDYAACVNNCEIDKLYNFVINGIDYNVGLIREILKGCSGVIPGTSTLIYDISTCPTPTSTNVRNISSDTIIIFTSDNGPYVGNSAGHNWTIEKTDPAYIDYAWNNNGSTGGMRGGQKFTYEGGVRVPFVSYWPNGTLKKGTSLGQLTDMMDIFPTLIKVAGGTVVNGPYVDSSTPITAGTISKFYVDGKDISAVLKSGTAQNKDIQISWFGDYEICMAPDSAGNCPVNSYEPSYSFAIRSNYPSKVGSLSMGNYKLYFSSTTGTAELINKPSELYNIYPFSNPREFESNGGNLCKSFTDYCTTYCDPSTLLCSSFYSTDIKNVTEKLWKKAKDFETRVNNGTFKMDN